MPDDPRQIPDSRRPNSGPILSQRAMGIITALIISNKVMANTISGNDMSGVSLVRRLDVGFHSCSQSARESVFMLAGLDASARLDVMML
jgi:hypothetical protein